MDNSKLNEPLKERLNELSNNKNDDFNEISEKDSFLPNFPPSSPKSSFNEENEVKITINQEYVMYKDIDDIFDIIDINDINDISEMFIKKSYIKVIKYITYISTVYEPFLDKLFEISTFEDIFRFMIKKPIPMTVEEISAKLGEKASKVRLIFNRKQQNFSHVGMKGNSKIYILSELSLDFLKNAIEKLKIKEQEEEKEKIRKKQEFQKKKEKEEKEIDFYNICKEVIQKVPKKREKESITISFSDILMENIELADRLLDNPQDIFEYFNTILEENLGMRFKISITNIPNSQKISIEEIRQEHIGKLLCLECRVVSLGTVRPLILDTTFECTHCGIKIKLTQGYGVQTIRKPFECPNCNFKNFAEIDNDIINSSNIMLEDLQEKTNNPNLQRARAILLGELSNSQNIQIFTPGNEVRINGILRTVPVYNRGHKTPVLGYLFEVLNGELFEPEVNIDSFSEEDIIEIKELSYKIDEKGFDVLQDSFAPGVFGYEEIKSAIMLGLCNRKNEIQIKPRNKPNILLIGDPGTAKSVLMDFAQDITPGSRRAVGGGSSAVGITASVVKEDESLGGYRVEPGALVLAKELLILDELNNLNDEDKPKLQEGMSEQTVTVNKANLHVKLKVTAGILAAANPKEGIFHNNDTPLSQFNIPSPILNRFDEIFVIRDNPDRERDLNIASKMLERERKKLKPKYDKEFLRKFFVYIRYHKDPEITESMGKKLKKLYSHLRFMRDKNFLINPRFMETLIRLLKASAKMRLSEKVEDKDIERGLNILNKTQFSTSFYKDLKELIEEQKEEEIEKGLFNEDGIKVEKIGEEKKVPLITQEEIDESILLPNDDSSKRIFERGEE
ncbi:MAG TPA: ATP-binding protein [Patescibacteria group bacterium]|nr:ATP-binding protein [Patescibacteria group bacterium]